MIKPVKAIFQSNGEVLLGEFVEEDYVDISDGGTGAMTKEGARANLELVKYKTYSSYMDMATDSPEETTLTKLDDSGDFYYSHNGEWRTIGSTVKVSGFDKENNPTEELRVDSLSFNDEFDLIDNDDGTIAITLDLQPIRSRLDVIEGDEYTEGSIKHAIYNLIDLAPDTLDTLNELASAIGDDPEFIKTINDKIDLEIQTRTSEDIRLEDLITALNTKLEQEIADRIAEIDRVVSEFDVKLANEKSQRVTGDNLLQTKLNKETLERTTTDNNLQTRLDAEEDARVLADINLQSNIDEETQSRIASDTQLRTDLTSETNSRISGDNLLQSKLDAETLARKTKDTELDSRLSGLISDESSTRQLKDNEIIGLLTNEETARIAEDDNLLSLINKEITDRTEHVLDVKGQLTTFIADQLIHNTDILNRLNVINGDESTIGSIKNAIKNVIGDAVESLDTLQEIATTLQNNPNIITEINNRLDNLNLTDIVNITLNYPLQTGDVLAYNEDTNRFESKKQSNGNFLKLVENDGDVNNVPVLRTIRGDTILESYIDFYDTNGQKQKLNMYK